MDSLERFHYDLLINQLAEMSDDQRSAAIQEATSRATVLRESIIHRGWRFFSPFYCFSCGALISLSQFLFARCCGSCDVSDSKTTRMLPYRTIFAGHCERLPNCGENPSDLVGLKILDPKTANNYPLRYRPKIQPLPPRFPRPSILRPGDHQHPRPVWCSSDLPRREPSH